MKIPGNVNVCITQLRMVEMISKIGGSPVERAAIPAPVQLVLLRGQPRCSRLQLQRVSAFPMQEGARARDGLHLPATRSTKV